MSHSVDETYAAYVRTRRKARKEHVCCACREPIAVGHYYMYVSVVFNGSAEDYKRCLRCETVFEALRKRLNQDDQWPDEDLACGHEWSENFGPEPDEIARLAFMSPAEAQEQLTSPKSSTTGADE